jgi:hypothetical protein
MLLLLIPPDYALVAGGLVEDELVFPPESDDQAETGIGFARLGDIPSVVRRTVVGPRIGRVSHARPDWQHHRRRGAGGGDAGLVQHAQDWRWGSLWRREFGDDQSRRILAEWPIDRRPDWLEYVDQPQTDAELLAVRECVARGRPYGVAHWQQETARILGLERSLLPRSRPAGMHSEASSCKGS